MSITAMQSPEAGPTTARPHLRLLPDLRATDAPQALGSVAPLQTRDPLHPLPSSGRRPLDLDAVRIETDLLARRACRTVGVLASWGTSRWRSAGDPETIASTFEITVTGPAPRHEVARRLTERLAADGWSGGITAMTPIVRIDAAREGWTLRLVATRRTITLRLSSAPLAVGEKLAQEVLSGMYEDD